MVLALALAYLWIYAAASGASSGAASSSGSESRWSPGVTVVKDSPLSPRAGPAVASTGAEIIVFGGAKPSQTYYPEHLLNDGAILDLRTGKWTRIASAPFDPPVVPAGVWTGRELVVLGSACIEEYDLEGELNCRRRHGYGAVYSRADDAWRTLPLPSEFQEDGCCFSPLVWSGTEAVFQSALGYIAVDPRTGQFRRVAPAPTRFGHSNGYTCVAGKHVVVAEDGSPNFAVRMFILDREARRWNETLEIPAELDPFGVRPTCTKSGVVLARADLSSIIRYDFASGQWSAIDPPELRPVFECTALSGCDGYYFSGHGEVVDFWRLGQHGFRYDTRDGTWTRITAGPDTYTDPGQLVWVDGLGATYSASATPRRRLAIYHPMADRNPRQPNVLLNHTTGKVSAPGLNAYLSERQPAWARDARHAAGEMVHLDQGLQAIVDERTEGADRTVVTITFLVYDLRNAIRYKLVFEEASDGYVRFVSGTWGQRCQPSRDANDFAPQAC